MTDPIYDDDLLWLRRQYLDEMPDTVEFISDPGEFALEMDASNGNGLHRRWTNRIAGDSFVGDFAKVLLPVHQAVKRLGPSPERRWLRAALNYRGLPCLCDHPRLTAHLAVLDRTDEARVVSAIRFAARCVVLRLGGQGFDNGRGSAKVPVGRRGSRAHKRVFETTDTVGANVIPGQALGSNDRGPRSFSRPSEKKLPDAPLCSCHAHLHGRPPKDTREAA